MKTTDPSRVHVAGPKAPAPSAPLCPHCGKAPDEPVAAAAPPAPVEPPPVQRYVVLKAGTFSMNGNMCSVAVGQVVSLVAYGRDGLQRMRDRGIVLQPCE